MFTIERAVNQHYDEEQKVLHLDFEKTAKQDFKSEMIALQMQLIYLGLYSNLSQ